MNELPVVLVRNFKGGPVSHYVRVFPLITKNPPASDLPGGSHEL